MDIGHVNPFQEYARMMKDGLRAMLILPKPIFPYAKRMHMDSSHAHSSVTVVPYTKDDCDGTMHYYVSQPKKRMDNVFDLHRVILDSSL